MTTRRPPRPAYQVVARELRAAILEGRFGGGMQMPTEAELVTRHKVSRQTVRRAFQDLVAEGLVDRVPGRGTFAAEPGGAYLRQFGSVDDLMSLSVDTTMRVVKPLRRRVNVDAAGRLRLTSDAVHSVEFLRFHDDIAFCVTTVSLPPSVAEVLADVPALHAAGSVSSATVIGLLDERLDDPVADAEQSITAVGADARVAAALGCAAGEPVLRVDRLYLAKAGQPVELAVSHFLPEHYSYRLRLRRSVP